MSDDIMGFSLDDLFAAPEVSFYYTVKPGALYAGEYPYWADKDQTLERLRNLSSQGVGLIIDLTHEGEDTAYGDILAEVGGMEHRRFSLVNDDVPTVEAVKTILDTIDSAHNEGKAVFVHCLAGIGRTGVVVGCYLARQGMNGQAALAGIKMMRTGVRDEQIDSPALQGQRDFILNWAVGQ
jgi:protein-tyrosine phosphatase